MSKICGIYKISSICKPERAYVGSAHNIKNRWNNHRHSLQNQKHHSKKLQRHVNKYGIDDLVFEIIEEGDYLCKNHLLAREQGWYLPYEYKNWEKPFFNNLKIAGSGEGGHHTQESRAKMSRDRLGKKKPPSHGPNVSKALKGKPKNISQEEIKANIERLANANRGSKRTKEQRDNITNGLKKHWQENPRKPVPLEERKKHGSTKSPQRIEEIKEWWKVRKDNGWKANPESQRRERDEKGHFKKTIK